MYNIISKTDNNNTQVCNSLGCFNKATIKIVLPVGSKSLTIVVCEKCSIKFE
ncbi:MAG: hypothetical protein K0R49_1855 [Burkholderiales bacterium]|jgi:hypothetical protein|nr:hypothetical protein [Burkholderiales bacterium]